MSATVRAGVLAAFVMVAGPVTADGPAEDLRVTGQCREGQSQGGYALRAPGGRLRVQGAFSHGARVGSFIFWSGAGVRIAHVPFDDDRISGTLSLWHPDAEPGTEPARKLVAAYRDGRRHGTARSWYADGQPRSEAEYVDGALQEVRAWSADGVARSDAEARTQAEQERTDDDALVGSLLALVRRHLPDCAPPPPRQRAGHAPAQLASDRLRSPYTSAGQVE